MKIDNSGYPLGNANSGKFLLGSTHDLMISTAFLALNYFSIQYFYSSKNKAALYMFAMCYFVGNTLLNSISFGINKNDFYRPFLGEDLYQREPFVSAAMYTAKVLLQDMAMPYFAASMLAGQDKSNFTFTSLYRVLKSNSVKLTFYAFAAASILYSAFLGYRMAITSAYEDLTTRAVLSGIISSVFLFYSYLSTSTLTRIAAIKHESRLSEIMSRDKLDETEKEVLSLYLKNRYSRSKGDISYVTAEEIEAKLHLLYDEQIAKKTDEVEEEPALKKEKRISSIRKMMLALTEKTEVTATLGSKPAIQNYPDFIESVFKTKQQTNAYYYKRGEIVIDLNSILKSHAKFRAENHDLKKIHSTASVYEYRFNNGQSDDRALGIKVEGYAAFLKLLAKLSVKFEESEARKVEEFAKRGDSKTPFTAYVFTKMSNHANLTKDANSMKKYFEK